MEQKAKQKRLKKALQRLIHWAKELAKAEEAYLSDENEANDVSVSGQMKIK